MKVKYLSALATASVLGISTLTSCGDTAPVIDSSTNDGLDMGAYHAVEEVNIDFAGYSTVALSELERLDVCLAAAQSVVKFMTPNEGSTSTTADIMERETMVGLLTLHRDNIREKDGTSGCVYDESEYLSAMSEFGSK